MKELYDKTNDSSCTSIIVRETIDFAINSKLRKNRLGLCAAKLLKRKRLTFKKYSIRTQGKPKIKAATKILVQEFYQNEKISKERPEKRFFG